MTIRGLTKSTANGESLALPSVRHPIHSLHSQMDRLWDDFFNGFDLGQTIRSSRERSYATPQVDVSETEKEYRFLAELPGVAEENVEVTLTDGRLTISGQKKSETKDETEHYLRTERNFGSFRRSFALPPDIDDEKIKASFRDGLLTVKVGKSKTVKPATKRIEIQKS